jgi:hypothetical protein
MLWWQTIHGAFISYVPVEHDHSGSCSLWMFETARQKPRRLPCVLLAGDVHAI